MRSSRLLIALLAAGGACGRGVSLDPATAGGGTRRLSGLWSPCGKLGAGAPLRVAMDPKITVEAILHAEGAIAVQRAVDHSLLTAIPGAGGSELALSPTGDRVATAGSARLAAWRTADGVLLFEQPGAYRQVVFSPDRERLLAVSAANTVEVRDAATGAALDSLGPFGGPLVVAGFSSEGRRVIVYDGSTGGLTRKEPVGESFIPVAAATAPAQALLSPEGDHLALVTRLDSLPDGRAAYTADMYDAATGGLIWSFGPEPARPEPAAAFSIDGAAFVISMDEYLFGFFVEDQAPFFSDSGGLVSSFPLSQVATLAANGANLLLVDASGVYSAERPTLSQRDRVSALPGQGLAVMAAAFSPDGKWLATSGFPVARGWPSTPLAQYPGDVTVWDLSAGTARQTIRGADAASVAFSPDSRRLLVGSSVASSNLREYPLYGGEAVARTVDVWLSVYGPGDDTVLLGSYHGVDAGPIAGPSDRTLLAGVAYPGVALSPDRRFVATTGPALWRADDLGRVWPASAPPPLNGDPDLPLDNWVAFSPGGDLVLTSDFATAESAPWQHGDDAGQPRYATATRLYRAPDGLQVRDFGAGVARRPAFSPDGAWIVAGGHVHAVEGDATFDLPLAGGLPSVSAFSPDGTIAVGREDGVVELFCPM